MIEKNDHVVLRYVYARQTTFKFQYSFLSVAAVVGVIVKSEEVENSIRVYGFVGKDWSDSIASFLEDNENALYVDADDFQKLAGKMVLPYITVRTERCSGAVEPRTKTRINNHAPASV